MKLQPSCETRLGRFRLSLSPIPIACGRLYHRAVHTLQYSIPPNPIPILLARVLNLSGFGFSGRVLVCVCGSRYHGHIRSMILNMCMNIENITTITTGCLIEIFAMLAAHSPHSFIQGLEVCLGLS